MIKPFHSSSAILALDEHFAQEWFHIALVTQREFAACSYKKSKGMTVLDALELAADPVATLNAHAHLGHGPLVVTLGGIETLEWHADDATVSVRYFDERKHQSRRGSAEFSSQPARARMLAAIRERLGPCDQSQESSSIWRAGTWPLIYSGIALAVFGGTGIAGYFKDGPLDVRNLRGKARFLGQLLEIFGPTGTLAIGLAITTAMMILWYFKCQSLPTKTVLQRTVVGPQLR